jgi:hypothetical protein
MSSDRRRQDEVDRPLWAWLFWVQLAVVLLATLGAYLQVIPAALWVLPGADKVLHLALYGGLAFLAVGWWAGTSANRVLAVLGILAATEEALQSLSLSRSCDPLDLAATLCGIALLGWLGSGVRGTRVPDGRAESNGDGG